MDATAPLVDMHAHILTRDMPRFDPAGTHPLKEDYSAERYIETLDAHGIQYGVLAPSSRVGYYFDCQIRALRRHKRLRSTVIIPFDTDLYGFERLDSEGVVGVRLAFRELEAIPDLATREFRIFLHRIRDFDWHVQVHVDAARLGHIMAPLLEVGVKVIIDHFGRPGPGGQYFDHVLAAVAADRVWIKLSAAYRLNATDEQILSYATRLLATGGSESLLWASDWPFTGGYEDHVSYDGVRRSLEAWIPNQADRHAIMSTNPTKVLRLDI